MKNVQAAIAFCALSAGLGACSHATDAGDVVPANDAVTTTASLHVAAGSPTYRVPLDGLPVLGKRDALVTMVEFTDYECPYCQKAEDTVASLRARYGDDLRIVVALDPLPFHPAARPAAIAALEADHEGAFAPMHASLFAQEKARGTVDQAGIVAAADAARIPLGRLAAAEAVSAAALDRAGSLAKRLGVQGTPSFFINGKLVVGAQPLEVFTSIIDAQLVAARALVARGVRPENVYEASVADGTDAVEADAGNGECAADD